MFKFRKSLVLIVGLGLIVGLSLAFLSKATPGSINICEEAEEAEEVIYYEYYETQFA